MGTAQDQSATLNANLGGENGNSGESFFEKWRTVLIAAAGGAVFLFCSGILWCYCKSSDSKKSSKTKNLKKRTRGDDNKITKKNKKTKKGSFTFWGSKKDKNENINKKKKSKKESFTFWKSKKDKN